MKLKAIAALGLLLVLAGTAAAQTTRAELPASDSFLGIATFPLWDGDAPGALGKGPADVPTLTIFRPHPGSGNGTAVIVAPGGAYLGLAANLEGRQVADWFTSRGVTAFVLKYRLGRNYLYPIPLTDARRAIRLVRSRAKEFGIAPDRVGMMGFSAGGHLTATAGTMFDGGQPDASDPVERVSSRPDFIILGYPWLNAMKPDQKGVLSYCSVLKVEPEKCKSFEQYSPDSHVSAQTPPAFIYHTTDDELVPVEASVTFYRALRAAGVPVEMHIFAKGKHGSGLGLGDAALDLWPLLLEAWLRARGLLTPDPAVAAEVQKASAPPAPRKPGAPFSVNQAVGELLANAAARAVLVNHLGEEFVNNIADSARQFSLRQVSQFAPDSLHAAKLQAIERDLAKVPIPR
ncbi:MAG TPA: alpha/beta hydrolase [Blastocatellia bacterium]|nr:alpha/beta hydrolase [Blastocatellia bacterium]